ncbi:MAG: glucans biosynthesis glucosyltransferase MdoH [Pseudomonadota bacterium]|uniref:glucans biosynthesis glucosyltransferase MdoH n=1 Tax=Phenylobacterium sp. TaxID=1871053 RepID=UPI0025FAF6FE|nr:glucans biosynthesis glucosyltransferase MdoH [Phenylobacterium sp.]MBT9470989.1 glucans biosynthesis glucosyltransferase MdoH [Phenylobacterium sp.]
MDRVTARSPARPWKPRTGPALRSLPPRRPLAMPVQDLERDTMGQACLGFTDSRAWRRTLVVGLTAVSTLGATGVMARLLAPKGFAIADGLMLALFALLFSWVAFAFISAVAGFVLMWRARDLEPWRPQPIIFTRTALLMPTYNEDPGRILSGVQAIYEELEALGVAELYDIFVLSDTRDAAIAQAEATGVLRLRLKLDAPDRIFYRRRALNLDRKAGNIADWVMRSGAGYESMIILDADSLMTGDTILRLTAAMERDRRVGLIQTLPSIIGASTLFARLQQFAARIYGPVIAQGQAWWSGAEGNYWGHNAIIRTRAFADCAGLPHIKGGKPFGGHIMSHDFVEAALLRRGGWAVRMAPDLTGSFEEAPPSLLDMAVRDRRWCQGNLQHSAVLGAKGLHWVSRLHLARGVLAYLTAPLWLAFLVVGGVVWAQQRDAGQAVDAATAGALFAATMALLLIPKVMGAVLIARRRASRLACGGTVSLALSVLAEIVISALMAPVFMLMHSRAVVEVLRGRHSGWAAQQRDEGRLKFKQAWRSHWLHTALGLAWAGAAFALDPVLLVWTSPVALGLVLAIPLSMATSRADAGAGSRNLGLFLTPEEAEPPAVMLRAAGLRAQYDAEAPIRAEIDRLFRAPAQVYRPEVQGSTVYLQAA